MLLNLSTKKILIGGIQGTGKTHLAKVLAQGFKTAVYTPHTEEWKNENVLIVATKDFLNDFSYWCKQFKKLAQGKRINLLVIDEADMLFKTHFDTCYELRDLIINHKHYNLAMIFVTRRPQDIPLKVYGTCEFIAMFTIEEPNAIERLDKYYDGFGQMVKSIPYDSHIFALKEIGKAPLKVKA